MVSGVVALMYDANDGLGWRDVQSILAASARHVGSEIGDDPARDERFAWGWNGAATWNGGGQHFSNDYGYGLVDARAAVRLAESWQLTGAAAATSLDEAATRLDLLDEETVIPDGDRDGITFDGALAADHLVERVSVRIAFSSTFLGDLEVYLISPAGTRSRLVADVGDWQSFKGYWTFESQAFRGERVGGDLVGPGRRRRRASTGSPSPTSSSGPGAPTPSTTATSSPTSTPTMPGSAAMRPTSSTGTAAATRPTPRR